MLEQESVKIEEDLNQSLGQKIKEFKKTDLYLERYQELARWAKDKPFLRQYTAFHELIGSTPPPSSRPFSPDNQEDTAAAELINQFIDQV